MREKKGQPNPQNTFVYAIFFTETGCKDKRSSQLLRWKTSDKYYFHLETFLKSPFHCREDCFFGRKHPACHPLAKETFYLWKWHTECINQLSAEHDYGSQFGALERKHQKLLSLSNPMSNWIWVISYKERSIYSGI